MIKKKYIALCLASFFSFNNAETCACGKTCFVQRSQDTIYQCLSLALNAYRRYQFDNDSFYADIDLYAGWEQNFKREKTSSYFFNSCGTLTVGPNNENFNVRASDLGLSSDYKGYASLTPRYSNLAVCLDTFFGLDSVTRGLWGQMVVPFTSTKWQPGLGVCQCEKGSYEAYTVPTTVGNAPAGQYTYVVTGVAANSVQPIKYQGTCAIEHALQGEKDGVSFGDTTPSYSAQIFNQDYLRANIYNPHFVIGYNVIHKERGALGLAIDVVPSVGCFPQAILNDTLRRTTDYWTDNIGSYHSTKLGGIIRGHYQLWNGNNNKSFALHAEGNLYNIFKAKTTRNLGLTLGNSGIFNHWLLLKRYAFIGEIAYYQGLDHAANLLRGIVEAKNNLEGQMILMGQYNHRQLKIMFGYNFYGRGAECLNLCYLTADLAGSHYVIKGEAPVFIPYAGNPAYEGGFYSPTDSNVSSTGTLVAGSQAIVNTIPASLVRENELKLYPGGHLNTHVAAHPQYISNTIFAALNYDWKEAASEPSLGLLAKVEFGNKNTALNMWGIYIKGAFLF